LEAKQSRIAQLEKEVTESVAARQAALDSLQAQIDSWQLKYTMAEEKISKADQTLAAKESEIQLAKDSENAARYAAQQAFAAREMAEKQVEKLTSEHIDRDPNLEAMLDAKFKKLLAQKEKELRDEMEIKLKQRELELRNKLSK